MSRLIKFAGIIVLLSSVLLVNGSAPGTPISKFDEFGDIKCEDEYARLDNFAIQLQREPQAKDDPGGLGASHRLGNPCPSHRKKHEPRGQERVGPDLEDHPGPGSIASERNRHPDEKAEQAIKQKAIPALHRDGLARCLSDLS